MMRLEHMHTKVGSYDAHVGVVSLARKRVTGAVAVGEQSRHEVADKCKHEHSGGSRNPTQLSCGPRQ